MTEALQNFERAYELVKQNIEASGCKVQLPGSRVVLYMNTCIPGILDVQDLLEADRTEFLQMAYYSLLETLPETGVIQSWQAKTELSEWAYRKAVLDTLMQNPEVAFKGRIIRNNIYADADECQEHAGRSLKQRFLSAGYRISRKLPLSIRIPLKKLAMKLLMRG